MKENKSKLSEEEKEELRNKQGFENYKKVYGIKDTSKYIDPTKRDDGIDRKEYTSGISKVEPCAVTDVRKLVNSGIIPNITQTLYNKVADVRNLSNTVNSINIMERAGIDVLVALSHCNKTVEAWQQFIASPAGKQFKDKLQSAKDKADKDKRLQEAKRLRELLDSLDKPEKGVKKEKEDK